MNHKLFLIDILKRYHSRDEDRVEETLTSPSTERVVVNSVSMIDDVDDVDNGFEQRVPYPTFQQTETWHDVVVDNDLFNTDITKIIDILQSFSDILTSIPDETNALIHVITLSDSTPVRVRQYSLPLHYEETIKIELTQMLNASLIEHTVPLFSR